MKSKDKKVIAHPGLYRAVLSCKIGRDAIEGKSVPPEGASAMEYAMYNLLHAVEEIANEMMTKYEGKAQ